MAKDKDALDITPEEGIAMGLRAVALIASSVMSIGRSWQVNDVVQRADRFVEYIKTGKQP